jgi:hypothetical protein
MLCESALYIVSHAYVKPCLAILKQVNAVEIRRVLVAGAGFEPAVRQLPDYEPFRDNPVME